MAANDSEKPPRSVLVFGGTFDPPHHAHVVLPPLAAAQLGCGRILYIPAAINPLKADSPPTDAQHRLAMLEIAIRNVPNAEASTIELDRAGPSYMVDTLEALREVFDHVPMRLLIGADQALEFHRWRSWERIIELAPPAVMIRPPWDRQSFQKALLERYDEDEAARWIAWTLDLPRIDVNATDVRRLLVSGGDVSAMLDPLVRDYIARHGLYEKSLT